MDQDDALRVARAAMKTALDRAGGDRARTERILLHMRIVDPGVDRAFTIAGTAMLEAEQANKH